MSIDTTTAPAGGAGPGRLKLRLVWALLCAGARWRGFAPGALARLRPYLASRWCGRTTKHPHPLQRPDHHFPGLAARPLHCAADFPWVAALEAAFPVIQAEVTEARRWAHRHQQDLVDRGHWNVLYFHSAGRRVEDGHRLCPRTAAILEAIPGVGDAGQVYLSVLSGGTHIAAHCGPTNTRLRCHLGISVPEGCRIRVGDDCHRWQEGRCLVFDDSFEHEVWHEGVDDRVVLILDVWHPQLSPAEIWALKALSRLSRRNLGYWRRSRRPAQPAVGAALR